MAKEYETPGDSFSDSSERPDPKSEYLQRLLQEAEANHIPPDALEDWLDVKFRTEALVDNNILWGQAIRSFTGHIPTMDLAAGLMHSQWRAINDNSTRFMVEITSMPNEACLQDQAVLEAYKKLQGYALHPELFEEADLRRRLCDCFYVGIVQLEYTYFVHQDDLGRLPDPVDLEDAQTFGGSEVYVITSGHTTGLRPYSPEVSANAYLNGISINEWIAETQANTLYNEALWASLIDEPLQPRPMPYSTAKFA